jgi:GTPase
LSDIKTESGGKKAAFAAIVGRPSAGKSSLLNFLCGWKVSIVSAVPQTTRNRIRGIVNRDSGQIVFLDTPGYHESGKKLNVHLRHAAEHALGDADLILYVADSTRECGPEEDAIIALAGPHASKTVLAINKIDDQRAKPDGTQAYFSSRLPAAGVFRISAKTGAGVEELLSRLFELSPEGQAFYPEEFGTDQEPEFRMAEIIREKAFIHTREEIPHSVYAEIADTEWSADRKSLGVRAYLVAERESQKGMLIGKDASMIKKIRKEAERDLNEIFPWKISLDLQVRVDKNWRQNDAVLKKLGIHE